MNRILSILLLLIITITLGKLGNSAPIKAPSKAPTRKPTKPPTKFPTSRPTGRPSTRPSSIPTSRPSKKSGIYIPPTNDASPSGSSGGLSGGAIAGIVIVWLAVGGGVAAAVYIWNKKKDEDASKSDQKETEMGETYNPISTGNENTHTEIYDDKW